MAKYVRITQHVTETITVRVRDDLDITNQDDYDEVIENVDSLRTTEWKSDVSDLDLELIVEED